MRIWHQDLIPHLCRQHLLAAWREGLGAYSIIVYNKSGYKNHPAVVEFSRSPQDLYMRLKIIRDEMLARGYRPKPMPDYYFTPGGSITIWQDKNTQVASIKSKGCGCLVGRMI